MLKIFNFYRQKGDNGKMNQMRQKLINVIMEQGISEVITKGESLGKNNQVANAIYYLEEGVCGLVRYTKAGEEVVYHYFQAGDILGGVYFNLAEEPSSYNYKSDARSYFLAKTTCKIYKIYYTQLNSAIQQEPMLANIISHSIAYNFHQVIGHVHEEKEEYTHVRLSRFLLKLSREIDGEDRLDKHFNYIEIAKYLSVHTVTISRIMATFKKKEMVEKRGHQIIIKNKGALLEVAQNMRNEEFL